MKCQILFSGKNKKNIINLSSAENAQRVVKVKYQLCNHFNKPFLKNRNPFCSDTFVKLNKKTLQDGITERGNLQGQKLGNLQGQKLSKLSTVEGTITVENTITIALSWQSLS